MRFIRDIIAERAEGKVALDEDASPVQDSPQPDRATDRTMTRLPEVGGLAEDDVFRRLLAEEEARKNGADHNIDELMNANSLPEETVEESNLFGDLGIEDPVDAPNAPDAAGIIHSQRTPTQTLEPEADEMPAPEQSFAPQSGYAAPAEPNPAPEAEDMSPGFVAVPAPASGRSGRGAGRVKTRLLGFGTSEQNMRDPFSEAEAAKQDAPEPVAEHSGFPVGWLVITEGPGRGKSFSLQSGVSQIGRGNDQAIRLDFGDTSISRQNHAAIAYDTEQGGFFLGHGGKANMVRLNDRPVLSTEEIQSGATIRIGETTLRFVALCDDSFAWEDRGANAHAASA